MITLQIILALLVLLLIINIFLTLKAGKQTGNQESHDIKNALATIIQNPFACRNLRTSISGFVSLPFICCIL